MYLTSFFSKKCHNVRYFIHYIPRTHLVTCQSSEPELFFYLFYSLPRMFVRSFVISHERKVGESPGKLNYFAFTQASRQTSQGGGGESLFFVLREFSRSCVLLPPGVTAFLMITRQNEGKLCTIRINYNIYIQYTFTNYRSFPFCLSLARILWLILWLFERDIDLVLNPRYSHVRLFNERSELIDAWMFR